MNSKNQDQRISCIVHIVNSCSSFHYNVCLTIILNLQPFIINILKIKSKYLQHASWVSEFYMLDHSDTQHLSSYFSVQKTLRAAYSTFLAIGIDKWWLAVNLKTVFNSLLEQAKHWEWKNLLIKFLTHAVLGNRWQREGTPGNQHTPGKTYTMNVFAPFVTSCLLYICHWF